MLWFTDKQYQNIRSFTRPLVAITANSAGSTDIVLKNAPVQAPENSPRGDGFRNDIRNEKPPENKLFSGGGYNRERGAAQSQRQEGLTARKPPPVLAGNAARSDRNRD